MAFLLVLWRYAWSCWTDTLQSRFASFPRRATRSFFGATPAPGEYRRGNSDKKLSGHIDSLFPAL